MWVARARRRRKFFGYASAVLHPRARGHSPSSLPHHHTYTHSRYINVRRESKRLSQRASGIVRVPPPARAAQIIRTDGGQTHGGENNVEEKKTPLPTASHFGRGGSVASMCVYAFFTSIRPPGMEIIFCLEFPFWPKLCIKNMAD